MPRKKRSAQEGGAAGTEPAEAVEGPPRPLGEPLAKILDTTTVRDYFEFANDLPQHGDNPAFAEIAATIGNDDHIAAFADMVIEQLADRPDLHERARAYVGAEEFRQEFFGDIMVLAKVTDVEIRRIAASSAPAIVAGWEQFGITPREDLHTDEARAQSLDQLVASLRASIRALSIAYIEHTVAVLTSGDEKGAITSGRKRPNMRPPTRPFAFPNEPGHRALMFATTKGVTDWESTEQGLLLRTPLRSPALRETLSIALDSSDYGEPNALGAVMEMLPAGEDGTALKTLLALPALFFDHNPDAQYNAVHETTIQNLMRYMGFTSKNGGFDREDQERVWRAVRLLNRLWIPGVTAHRKRGQTTVTNQNGWFSPVIVLQGVQQGTSGVQLPQAIRYSLGKEFHAYYLGAGGMRTRMLTISPRIMELHGRRDINPLRLAVYYAGQFRINKEGFKHGRESIRVKYANLLEHAGVPLDKKNPQRQFQRVLTWHEELAAKGIIGACNHPTPPPPRSPFTDYATLIFSVQPPATVVHP